MSFVNNLINNFKHIVLNQYTDFNGRTRRRDYWMFILAYIILSIIVSIINGIVFGRLNILPGLLFLALIVPAIALAVRRLHDISLSGWFVLVGFIPFFGWVAAIIMACIDSTPGTNAYGPNPKGINTDPNPSRNTESTEVKDAEVVSSTTSASTSSDSVVNTSSEVNTEANTNTDSNQNTN